MLRLPEAWVWDFWLVDDGQSYHLFFLYASRALHDPDARHHRASVGHAISDDLTTWTRVPDALVRSDPPPSTTSPPGPDRSSATPTAPGSCSTPGPP